MSLDPNLYACREVKPVSQFTFDTNYEKSFDRVENLLQEVEEAFNLEKLRDFSEKIEMDRLKEKYNASFIDNRKFKKKAKLTELSISHTLHKVLHCFEVEE